MCARRNTIIIAITPGYPLTVLTRPTPIQHKALHLQSTNYSGKSMDCTFPKQEARSNSKRLVGAEIAACNVHLDRPTFRVLAISPI